MNKKTPLYRQVYEDLRKDIMDGIYQPGEYLPPIREEAKRLGVARNTIENAYMMLAEEGYIQAKPGQGSRVSDAWRSLYFGDDASGEKAEDDLSCQKNAGQHAGQTKGSGGREEEEEALHQSMKDRTGIKRHGETEGTICIDFRGKPPLSPMFPRGIGSMLETRLLQDCKGSGEIPAGERVCSRIRRYLKIHRGITCTEEQIFLDPRIGLTEVAERLHTNKTYISKLVNNTYKLGFPELVNNLRVEYAEQYIINHRKAKQTEIAAACGFLSASSFNNTFKRVTGTTPKLWLAGIDKQIR